MEFGCSICEYVSDKKSNIVRHINKKKSCGIGTREIIEIPIDIVCEYCDKNFSTKEHMKEHVKNNCKHKDRAKDDEIKKLKEELQKARRITNNNIDNSINTVNINITVNYEDTKLDKITDKIYNNIINDEVYQIIPKLIKHIHFNPDIPENHNIYLSNRNTNNKHLQVYRNGHWEIENKNTEIDNLIYDKETNLSDWVAEKGEKYPDAKERFGEYLDQRHDDNTIKLVKEGVELILYNGRHMIKN
jgi:transcriptional regulator NrdR family protein